MRSSFDNSLLENIWVRIAFAILLYAGVFALTVKSAHFIGSAVKPLVEATIKLSYPRFDDYNVQVKRLKSEWVYYVQANNTREINVGGSTLPANLNISSQTLIAHSVQHILFFFALVIAGSTYFRYRPLILIAGSLCSLLLLELIDVPFVLSGSIEDLLLSNFNPEAIDRSLRIRWMEFLTNGGRIALAMVLGWLVMISSGKPVRQRADNPSWTPQNLNKS